MSMRVPCQLSDCLSYVATGVPKDVYCQCSHPDKRYYLNATGACPLYRADWNKTANQIKNLQAKFKIGGVCKK
jgi:hypothetical protein